MSRWLSRNLGAPRLDWFRWCASREPASSSKKHKPRVVDPSGRTKAKLLLMACEPDARSSTRHDPMLVEASGRTKAWPSW